jgi:hypothetical protein
MEKHKVLQTLDLELWEMAMNEERKSVVAVEHCTPVLPTVREGVVKIRCKTTRSKAMKLNLNTLTDADLLAEMERRKAVANKPPEPLTRPDFTSIVKFAQEMVEQRVKKHEDCDNDHWCFEAILTAVYGKAIWDWWNKQDE